MAPSTREWWRIPHLPTEETYIISEDHTIMFEQIIEKYPEFLRNMHAFLSTIRDRLSLYEQLPGEVYHPPPESLSHSIRGLVSTLISDHQIRELEVSLNIDIDLDLTVALQLLLPLTRFLVSRRSDLIFRIRIFQNVLLAYYVSV